MEQPVLGNWHEVQKRAQDTVVQIFAKIANFNWFEPYKSPTQAEHYASGFFINEDGYLVTNFHVVHEASAVEIQIPSLGREQFDCEIVGVHPTYDIALLRLKDADLARIRAQLGRVPFLPFGDSDKVFRTQELVALGYPLAQQGLKSTQGIISGREKINMRTYLQITAPLNPGSSGGPVLDQKGEVIGISFAGVLQAQNVGYVIPINEVVSAIRDLFTVPLLRRPYLGGIFSISNQDMVTYLGNPGEGGFYIAKVAPNTLLANSGVKEGDMIYEINGFELDRFGELPVPWSEDRISVFDLLNRFKVGDEIKLLIYRKGKKKKIKFTLALSEVLPIRYVYPKFEEVFYETIGGLVVMELTLNHVELLLEKIPSFINYHRADAQHIPKLIITNVLHNSQADRSHALQPGDILAQVNGEKVQDLQQFRQAVAKSKETGFLTLCTGENLFTVLSVDKILAEEDVLAQVHHYQKSSLLDMLS